ncbi:MAG: helix-turn-helix domain-containing protein [Dermatophilaceae bacterium]
MARISVADAARWLGVSERRVQQRITDGSVRAERIGARWAIDERDLLPLRERRTTGRPVSERSAWAIIATSAVLVPTLDEGGAVAASAWLSGLASAERLRARTRLRDLVAAGANVAEVDTARVAAELRVLLGNRAARTLMRASPRDLSSMRDDERLVPAGLSHPESGIIAGDLVEGYLDAASLNAFDDDHLLEPARRDDGANVILHVVSDHVAERAPGLWRDSAALPLVLAVDLAEHRRPREQSCASGLVAGLRGRMVDG